MSAQHVIPSQSADWLGNPSSPTVGCVLLASGFARRYGSNKLLSLRDGRPLYQHAFAALPAPLFTRAVVTSQYDEILAYGGSQGYIPLPNPHAAEGIAAGLRLGLTALRDLDGVLFAVCDQPNLKTNSISNLINSFQQSPQRIHALSFQGRRGNPVLFPRALFPELLALTGDTGGSNLLKRHPDLVTLVEVSTPSELEDVDHPD